MLFVIAMCFIWDPLVFKGFTELVSFDQSVCGTLNRSEQTLGRRDQLSSLRLANVLHRPIPHSDERCRIVCLEVSLSSASKRR